MTFLNLNWFFWLPVFLALFFLFTIIYSLKYKKILTYIPLKSFKRLSPSFSFSYKILHMSFGFLALIFMVFALARPQQTNEQLKDNKSQGVEIIFMVDVSLSMLANDVKPTRLSLAKSEMDQWISQSSFQNRYGLIAFAGSAVLLSPLTSDTELVRHYIQSLNTDTISSQGTDFKQALVLAEKAFEKGALEPSTKVLVILSDGEDHELGALKQVQKMKGIHIFVLGFGTQMGSSILHPDTKEYLRDERDQVVHTTFKEKFLKELAKYGEGAFYHISKAQSVVPSLQKDILKLDQHSTDTSYVKKSKEFYQMYLFFSLLFAILYWIATIPIFKPKRST